MAKLKNDIDPEDRPYMGDKDEVSDTDNKGCGCELIVGLILASIVIGAYKLFS